MEQRRVNIRTSFPSPGHRSPHQSRVGTMIWASAGGHFLAPAPDLFIITVTAASAHTYVLCHWLGVSGLGDVSSLDSTAEDDSFTTMLSCDTDIVLAYCDHVPRAAAVPGLVGVCRLARRVCGTSHTFTSHCPPPGSQRR